ncbi:MAG: hypothetical protein LC623_03170 [Halobacteriales archaeon]|nr:hypothetical protein [Halobacteriales archaeon]
MPAMTVRGLLRVAPVLLALMTLATPAQADPTCVASAVCVSDPCGTGVCSDPSAMPVCPTYLCVHALLTCEHVACVSAPHPSGPSCSAVDYDGSGVYIHADCLLRLPPPAFPPSGTNSTPLPHP